MDSNFNSDNGKNENVKVKQIKIIVVIVVITILFFCVLFKTQSLQETRYAQIAEKIIKVLDIVDIAEKEIPKAPVATEQPASAPEEILTAETETAVSEALESEVVAMEKAANEDEETLAESNGQVNEQIPETETATEVAQEEASLSRDELVEKWVDIAVDYARREHPEIQGSIGAMWDDINENTISIQVYESMETHISTICWLEIDIYTGYCKDGIFGDDIDLMEP